MELRNSTKLFVLIVLLDLLTTMVGFQFGFVEGWSMSQIAPINMYLIKLNYVVIGITVLEFLPYTWLLWISSIMVFPPVPWNIWMLVNGI